MANPPPTSDRRTPRPGDAIARQLDPVVELLVHPDAGERKGAVSTLLHKITPPARRVLIDLLIDRLKDRSGGVRDRAADSLAEMGAVAVVALCLAALRSRSRPVRRGAVGVLTRVAPSLPPARQVRVQLRLAVATSRTDDRELVRLAARFDAAVRASQRGGRQQP
jgi:HEAT repeat protein